MVWQVGLWAPYPCCADQPLPIATRTFFSRSILLSLHSVARKSVGSKCAKISSVRMHKQMAESSPPQKEQTASGRGGGEGEHERGADSQLNESWNVSQKTKLRSVLGREYPLEPECSSLLACSFCNDSKIIPKI